MFCNSRHENIYVGNNRPYYENLIIVLITMKELHTLLWHN